MATVPLHTLTLDEAQQALPLLTAVLNWRQSQMLGEAVAVVVPHDDHPHELGVDEEFVLLVLPDDLAPLLPELASKTFFVYNRDSEDLLSRQTLMSLMTDDTWVEVDAWQLRGFSPSVAAGKFYVGIAAADRFVLVMHDFGAEEMDAFLGALQGACCSSGPNYKPERYWTEEELQAAAAGDIVWTDSGWNEPSRRVECQVIQVQRHVQ